MLKQLTTILECSRAYAIPMTIMSWVVIFTFSCTHSGNILYGLLALIGICLSHFSTNILDDFFDYKTLIKQVNFDKKEYMQNSQKTKCRLIISGVISTKDLLMLAGIYLSIASFIGLFLFIKCGIGVIYFALIGAFIVLFYSFFSKRRLSEVAVAIAYGPALFGGVYYVMLKAISWEVFLLALPTTIITLVLLYNHTVMDYKFDLFEGHKTIANSFKSQKESIIILKILLILAYTSPLILCIFDVLDWQVIFTWLTIPLAIDLYNSMQSYLKDPESMPEHKWYHFPMENMRNAPAFMTRMYQSRNLMIYYSTIYAIAIILAL